MERVEKVEKEETVNKLPLLHLPPLHLHLSDIPTGLQLSRNEAEAIMQEAFARQEAKEAAWKTDIVEKVMASASVRLC